MPMRRPAAALTVLTLSLMALPWAAAQEPSANTKSAVAFVAIYDAQGDFAGWGTGFYVDEGIVVTNKHVIDGGMYYRVYTADENDTVDLKCFRTLTRSDVKINLDDDVAYMRAYVECPHGAVYFANSDPKVGEAIGVLGYPTKGSVKESMVQTRVSGTVTGIDGLWMTTDAPVDFGNSGGPVMVGDRVAGVIVAKSVTAEGEYIEGLFVPVSQILRGLENANDSSFGYRPQSIQQNPVYQLATLSGPATDADCTLILGEGGQAADDGSCRCARGYKRDSTGTMCIATASSASSSVSTATTSSSSARVSSSHARTSASSSKSSNRSSASGPTAAAQTPFAKRVCERVQRLFSGNAKMINRVNERLQRRFGFTCATQ